MNSKSTIRLKTSKLYWNSVIVIIIYSLAVALTKTITLDYIIGSCSFILVMFANIYATKYLDKKNVKQYMGK